MSPTLTPALWPLRLGAGALALALHVAAVALLLVLPSQSSLLHEPPKLLTTQVLSLPIAPEPLPPVQPAIAEPIAEITPPPIDSPPKPVAKAQPKPVPEKADMALRRAQERQDRKALELAQRQAEQQAQELAQERQKQAEALAKQAQAQQSAARAAAQAAAEAEAASRQYVPISKAAPSYPTRALDKRIEGSCTVAYRVNEQGYVEAPQALEDCHPLFVRPSLQAAKQFRYQPRIINGQVVAVHQGKNIFHYRIQ